MTENQLISNVVETRKFYKEDGRWYIDLPEYIEAGGTKGDLQMVAGADTWLDKLSGNTEDVIIKFSNIKFEGWQDCMAQSLYFAGGWQVENNNDDVTQSELDHGKWYTTKTEGHELWLCPVTKFVFDGTYPKVIFYSVIN